jgi:hypothetical protein
MDGGYCFSFLWPRRVATLGLVVSILFGAIAAIVREASHGFVLIQHCGSGYLIRSVTTTCLLCGVVTTVAYILSVI